MALTDYLVVNIKSAGVAELPALALGEPVHEPKSTQPLDGLGYGRSA